MSKNNKKKSWILNLFLIITVIISIIHFILIITNYSDIKTIINGLLLLLFSVLFSGVISTNYTSKKAIQFFSIFILLGYQLFGISNYVNINSIDNSKMDNLTGKSLVEVMKWSTSKNIDINYEYEYSDLVEEYKIISQSLKEGSSLKDIKDITVSISEGPSPYKEVIVPNMLDWDTEKVLDFVKKNHLTNVLVEFVASDKNENTVIEQSKSGNLMRNEEIKLVFSYGEERHYDTVKLRELSKLSKFEAEFYLKQYGIRYSIDEDFSSSIKRGYVLSQSIDPGSEISISSDEEKILVITISKGKKIKVPDLSKMSIDKITEWVIENKLKVGFEEKYDDTIEKGKIIETSYKKGDIIEEGTLINIVLSKGELLMPKFRTLSEFREWSDKYGINYEEQHEFSDKVDAGEVISYSYDKGKPIKNGDSIIVVISDGDKCSVPNLKGLTKSEAIKKLEKANLEYNFVTKYSDSIEKGKVINQSISSSSEVSCNTTITVTISNGKAPTNNNNNNNSNNNSGNNNNNNTPSNPTPTCNPVTYTIGRDLNNIFVNYSGFDNVKSAIISFFNSNYPNVKISVIGVDGGDATSGSYIGGIGPGSQITSCGDTYTIQIAK